MSEKIHDDHCSCLPCVQGNLTNLRLAVIEFLQDKNIPDLLAAVSLSYGTREWIKYHGIEEMEQPQSMKDLSWKPSATPGGDRSAVIQTMESKSDSPFER